MPKRGGKSSRGGKPRAHRQPEDFNQDGSWQGNVGNSFKTSRGGKKRNNDSRQWNESDFFPSMAKVGKNQKSNNFDGNFIANQPPQSFPGGKKFSQSFPRGGHAPNLRNQTPQSTFGGNNMQHSDEQFNGNFPPLSKNQRFNGNFRLGGSDRESTPFGCQMCGKPFKKQVLLDMHLKTECKAMMSNPSRRSNFPPNRENFQQAENNFPDLPSRKFPSFESGFEGHGSGHPSMGNAPNQQNFNSFSCTKNLEDENSVWSNGENCGNPRNFREKITFSRNSFHEQNHFMNRNFDYSNVNQEDEAFFQSDNIQVQNKPFNQNQRGTSKKQFSSRPYPYQDLPPFDENSNDFNDASHLPKFQRPPLLNNPDGAPIFRKGFVCNLCELVFSTAEEHYFHVKEYHFKCKFCSEIHKSMVDLLMHQETHIIGDNSSNATETLIPQNMGASNNPANFERPFSHFDGPAMNSVEKQSTFAGGSLRDRCFICSEPCPKREILVEHMNSFHHQLLCSLCDFHYPSFEGPAKLQDHLFNAHPKCVLNNASEEEIRVPSEINQPNPDEVPPTKPAPSFPCCLCTTTYTNFDDFTAHIDETHKPTVVCKVCGDLFKDVEQLSGHTKYEHGTDVFPEKERLAILAHTDHYPCEMCKEKQCNYQSLQYHMYLHRVHRIKHEPKNSRQPYIACPNCNVLCKSSGLKNHILNNHKLVTCSICDEVFSDKLTYVKHVDLEHYPNCVCNICCNICFNNNALQQHGAVEHAMGEVFKCNFCSKKFGLRELLNIHELLHPELYSQCKVCGEFFKIPELLLEFRSHMIEIHGMDMVMMV